MNKLHTLIFSAFCITTSVSCSSTNPSTHKDVLQYDLAQRKATQKLASTIRNVSATCMLIGTIVHILCDGRFYALTRNDLIEYPVQVALVYPLFLMGVHLQKTIIAAFASALYSAYNNLHIEALEAELNKLNRQEPT